jgi:hypothetical protein
MATYEGGQPDFLLLIRPEDLLYLEVDIHRGQGEVWLWFPSQHVMEHPTADPLTSNTVQAFGADPNTALKYALGADEALQLGEGLLARLHRQPGRAQVEFPTMMLLAEHVHADWDLIPEPRGAPGWTGAWRAELVETGRIGNIDGLVMRVADTQGPSGEPPGWHLDPFASYPDFKGGVFATRLALSMTGATGRLHGPFGIPGQPAPPGVGGKTFDLMANTGRDIKTVLETRGFLSTGHPAMLTTVTSRAFVTMQRADDAFTPPDPSYADGQTYLQARLVQTTTLTVLEPVVQVASPGTPFRSMRVTETVFTHLDAGAGPARWVTRANQDVHFPLVATDWSGRETAFSAPVMFIDAGAAGSADALQATFNDGPASRRTINLAGAPVTLADTSAHPDIDHEHVTLPVHEVVLGLADMALGAGSALVPKTVDVALDAAGRVTGQVQHATCHVLEEIDGAKNFLKMVDNGAVQLNLPAAQVGGLANPDMVLTAVNAAKGAIPTGSLTDMFGKMKILGADLLGMLPDLPAVPQVPDVPELRSLQLPDSVTTSFEWKPTLKTPHEVGIVRLEAGATLELKGKATVSIDLATGQPRPPTTEVTGTLTKASLVLMEIITVKFGSLEFHHATGKSPSLVPKGVAVELGEQMKFVKELAESIPGFDAKSPIHVDSSSVTAGYDVQIPTVNMGYFLITNIALGAAVRIPFNGDPSRASFHFGERHAPFNLSVDGIGGGGYFLLEASTKALELVEISLEFGGTIDIDVFVATGTVQVMGGARLRRTPDTLTVTAYLRCSGHVKVLDVVEVSVEFELSLSYSDNDSRPGELTGAAHLSVGISVLFLHESVSFDVEKTIETDLGGDHDAPGDGLGRRRFALPLNALESADAERAWDQLCEAFA